MSTLATPLLRQRLVICFDGTWNDRHDSTNVFHHFCLVTEGPVAPVNGVPFVQRKHYILGVGTGVLDRVRGGGFGVGLERNVRSAYDWLVEHYRGDDRGAEADEIYIFGFSRGAYTARSLIGLISTCGLLRRGAPITVNQLWNAYRVFGRERDQSGDDAQSAWGADAAFEMRSLPTLVIDPWSKDAPATQRDADGNPLPAEPMLRPDAGPLNPNETLLVHWSRRIRVHYLGLYDTVGAMGLDALAIPGLRNPQAAIHNLRATVVIGSCRHAFALNEHRSGFAPTPFSAYIPHKDEPPPAPGSAGGQAWRRKKAQWRDRIEQRWFVGAHSNIGGGYESNDLARHPFAWVHAGAVKRGLVCEPPCALPPLASPPEPRDSYLAFAAPFSTQLFRFKRYHRRLLPLDRFHAPSQKKRITAIPSETGFTIASINETIALSVFRFYRRPSAPPPPPRLVAWVCRRRPGYTEAAAAAWLAGGKRAAERALAGPRLPKPAAVLHPWVGASTGAAAILVVWASLAAYGFAEIFTLLLGAKSPLHAGAFPEGVPGIDGLTRGCAAIAGLMVFVDWGESRANFRSAFGAARWVSSVYDSLIWLRALGAIAFFAGLAGILVEIARLGIDAHLDGNFGGAVRSLAGQFWPIAAAAGGAALIALNLPGERRARAKTLGAGLGGALALVIPIALLGLLFLGLALFAGFGTPDRIVGGTSPDFDSPAARAGRLCVLLLLFIAVAREIRWTNRPIRGANLGTQWNLYLACFRPGGLARYYAEKKRAISRSWLTPDIEAIRHLRNRFGKSLWRDLFALVPLYLLTLEFGLWFAGKEFGEVPFAGRWLGVVYWAPVVTVLADVVENILHLRFLRQLTPEAGAPGAGAPAGPGAFAIAAAAGATVIKTVAFAFAAALVVAAFFIGLRDTLSAREATGWRGGLLVVLTIATVATAVGYALRALLSRRTP